jgi:hypothetical protein
VGPTAENCFNGTDDDCNGAVDCADSACTAIATCVEDSPGFALGTVVDSATDCLPS